MCNDGVAGGQSAAHAGRERALGARGADLAEGIVGQIEQSQALDAFAQTLGSLVAKVLQPGKLKDLLSGTWMGHPAHPMLTDVPIGAWTSAFVLDMVEGEGARSASDLLVGLGVVAALPTAVSGPSDLSDVVNDEVTSLGGAHTIPH